MKFRETKAWTCTTIIYWALVFSAATLYYWLSFIKSFQ